MTKPIIKMAEEASVEVAINLDHGHDVAIVKQCLADGFSSVMMDASSFPYEENVAITKNGRVCGGLSCECRGGSW